MTRIGFLLALAAAISAAVPAAAVEMQITEAPQVGTYYERWEPTFYTGFAPRGDDPARIHLHVGRGNQLRITLLLSDAVEESYARDLKVRRDTYRALVDGGRIVLTQNAALADFEATLDALRIDGLVAEEASLSPEALRARNVKLMARLNPGRVFEIEIPERALVDQWTSRLQPADPVRVTQDRDRRLELLNALLPTRLWITESDAATTRALKALVTKALAGGEMR